jgi:hypothetical protein
MKAVEFKGTVAPDGHIAVPPEVALELPVWGTPNDDGAWRVAGRRQFEAAYAPEDSVYEQLIDETPNPAPGCAGGAGSGSAHRASATRLRRGTRTNPPRMTFSGIYPPRRGCRTLFNFPSSAFGQVDGFRVRRHTEGISRGWRDAPGVQPRRTLCAVACIGLSGLFLCVVPH